MRYITSDLHFRHKNILKFYPSTRPYNSTEEMEADIINKINSLENCEMLYHVGDFFFGKARKVVEVLDHITVPMTFIWGNHDNRIIRKIITEDYNHTGHDYHETKSNGKKVVMFHYPIYKDWNNAQHGSCHLFGHVHGRDIGSNGKSLDVGWDAHGRILTLNEAVEMADANKIDTFHGER